MAWVNVTPPVTGTPVATTTFGTTVAGNLAVLGNAWTVDARASSVIWTGNVSNPVLGNGTLVSRYRLVGKTCDWEVVITIGSVGASFGSGQWKLVPPATPATTGGEYPVGAALDTSAGNRFMVYAIKNSASFDLQSSVTAGALTTLLATSPMTWAAGDVLSFQTTFETA